MGLPFYPQPKPLPRILAKKEKATTKAQREKDFRAAVWTRDEGKSRASGKPLSKSSVDWDRRGEVHHVLARSTNPDRVYDLSNGILLSKTEHALAETGCPGDASHCLLDIDGPIDRGRPQRFTWRDVQGKVLREKVG